MRSHSLNTDTELQQSPISLTRTNGAYDYDHGRVGNSHYESVYPTASAQNGSIWILNFHKNIGMEVQNPYGARGAGFALRCLVR